MIALLYNFCAVTNLSLPSILPTELGYTQQNHILFLIGYHSSLLLFFNQNSTQLEFDF